jgi:hypothetical protein
MPYTHLHTRNLKPKPRRQSDAIHAPSRTHARTHARTSRSDASVFAGRWCTQATTCSQVAFLSSSRMPEGLDYLSLSDVSRGKRARAIRKHSIPIPPLRNTTLKARNQYCSPILRPTLVISTLLPDTTSNTRTICASDVIRGKRSLGWRTVLVIPELENEVDVALRENVRRKRIQELRELRDELDEVDALRIVCVLCVDLGGLVYIAGCATCTEARGCCFSQ